MQKRPEVDKMFPRISRSEVIVIVVCVFAGRNNIENDPGADVSGPRTGGQRNQCGPPHGVRVVP